MIVAVSLSVRQGEVMTLLLYGSQPVVFKGLVNFPTDGSNFCEAQVSAKVIWESGLI